EKEGELVSQSDLDALFAARTDEAADDMGGIDEADLDALLAGGDSLGDELYDAGGAEPAPVPAGGEMSLDEMLGGGEPTPVGGDDMDMASAMRRDGLELPEEGDDTVAAGAGGMTLMEKIQSLLAPLKKRLGALLPKGKGGRNPKVAYAVMAGAAVLTLAAGAGGWWFFYGNGADETTVVAEAPAPETSGEPTAPPTDQATGEAAAPEDDLLVASPESDPTAGSPTVAVGVYLPVEFDREAIRIMTVETSLAFGSAPVADALRSRIFFVATTIEGAVQSFFSDKFYEDTIFVQDKLEEYLTAELGKMEPFTGLTGVKVERITFENDEEPEAEVPADGAPAATDGAAPAGADETPAAS
ncbi:MAG: hypothetical protein HQK87_01230, partial [Nitrospinae bacterium]|nr:hypothetical protein [Nitrospinota bacterium]